MRITDSYLIQQRQMHAAARGYGTKGDRWASTVHAIAREMCSGEPVRAILDYGCGQGQLVEALRARGLQAAGYDPAVKRYAGESTQKFDLTVCTDVLEHVEPECLGAVLEDIYSRTTRVLWVVIALQECGKTLPDGRNAHINLRSAGEWDQLFKVWYHPAPRELQALLPALGDKHYTSIWSKAP